MIKTLTKKLQDQKQTYNFKDKDIGVAGICPDCGGIVTFNSYHQRYQCSTKECCFEANLKGARVWDNLMRDENIKKMKTEQSL